MSRPPSVSVGNWFQEPPQISKSRDAQVPYVKWRNTGGTPYSQVSHPQTQPTIVESAIGWICRCETRGYKTTCTHNTAVTELQQYPQGVRSTHWRTTAEARPGSWRPPQSTDRCPQCVWLQTRHKDHKSQAHTLFNYCLRLLELERIKVIFKGTE